MQHLKLILHQLLPFAKKSSNYPVHRFYREIVALAMYNAGTYGVIRGTPYSTLKYVAQVMEYKENLEDKFQREVLRVDRVVTLSWVAGDS